MELMLRAAALAAAGTLCACVLRRGAPELALVVTVLTGVCLLMWAAQALESAMDMLSRLTRLAGLEGALVEPVVKIVGLSIITRVTGELCRSAGEGGIAAFVEAAGTVLALGAALPLVEQVVEMVVGML